MWDCLNKDCFLQTAGVRRVFPAGVQDHDVQLVQARVRVVRRLFRGQHYRDDIVALVFAAVLALLSLLLQKHAGCQSRGAFDVRQNRALKGDLSAGRYDLESHREKHDWVRRLASIEGKPSPMGGSAKARRLAPCRPPAAFAAFSTADESNVKTFSQAAALARP